LLDAEFQRLDDLMTCPEALLNVMDSFGFSLIFIDLGVFQVRGYGTVVVPL
jgi:hypothetical protein